MADYQQRSEIAREGLQRTTPFVLERAGSGGGSNDGFTLEGHAAVFNSPTVIDSWEGRFKEQTARGSFKRTFSARTPVLQFDHGHHPLVGSIPIGRINTAKEDTQGAYVKARLHDNWLIQPVRDAIASESITGMSFRFSVVQEEWRDADGNVVTDPNKILQAIYRSDGLPEDQLWTRTLRELKVPELGPVVFPAYESTDVGVRSGGTTVIDLASLRTDPDARKKLARALWVAEQPGHNEPDEQRTDEQQDDDDGDTTPDAVAAIRQVGQQINEALTALAELVTAGGRNTAAPTPTEDEPPSDDDERAASQTSDSADGHSDDTAPTEGHADPAPAPQRHAGEHDDSPSEQGHSSRPIPPTVATRDGRRSTLAYLEELWQAGQEKRSIYERAVDDMESSRTDQEG